MARMSSLRNGRWSRNPCRTRSRRTPRRARRRRSRSRPSTDVIHGRTVIRPSATSGRYSWLRVTPAANSDGSGAGAPYCSGLPPASTTISLSCRSISGGGQRLVGEGSVSREDPMVGGDARRELRQHVPLPALGDDDARRAELGEFGGDLESADRAARHQNPFAAIGRGPR